MPIPYTSCIISAQFAQPASHFRAVGQHAWIQPRICGAQNLLWNPDEQTRLLVCAAPTTSAALHLTAANQRVQRNPIRRAGGQCQPWAAIYVDLSQAGAAAQHSVHACSSSSRSQKHNSSREKHQSWPLSTCTCTATRPGTTDRPRQLLPRLTALLGLPRIRQVDQPLAEYYVV